MLKTIDTVKKLLSIFVLCCSVADRSMKLTFSNHRITLISTLVLCLSFFTSFNLYSNTIAAADTFIIQNESLDLSGTYTVPNLSSVNFTFFDELGNPNSSKDVTFNPTNGLSIDTPSPGNWRLILSPTDILGQLNTGVYFVELRGQTIAGVPTSVATIASLSLLVDISGPVPFPTVTTLIFNDDTPTITGTYANNASSGDQTDSIDALINGVQYFVSGPQIIDTTIVGGNTWQLDVSSTLSRGDTFPLIVSTFDTTGINVSDTTVDIFIGNIPTIVSQFTADPTPIISGTVDTDGSGNLLMPSIQITVAGVNYTQASSELTFSEPNTFQLDLSNISPLVTSGNDSTFEITVTTIDPNGVPLSDISTGELTIDLGDFDGDGIPNFTECQGSVDPSVCDNVHSDTDLPVNIPDWKDLDSDNDLIPDSLEKYSNYVTLAFDPDDPIDTDTNGVPNYRDTDSDGDGILDIDESGQYFSVGAVGEGDTIFFNADLDTIPNYMELDADGDKILDTIETVNNFDAFLGDIYPNYLDIDSDNDNIKDSIEAFALADGDSIPDSNGVDAPFYINLDSDNDGILDSTEVKDESGAIAATPNDFDGDGIPNYLDLNSDSGVAQQDAILDALEGGGDFDGDGVLNYLDNDVDGDGITDEYEYDGGGLFTTNLPSNRDGTDGFDFIDIDSDGDGILDSLEADGNISGSYVSITGTPDNFSPLGDGDMIPNHLDFDSDGDSIPDLFEGAKDTIDLDGELNYLDLNSDGDNLSDSLESGLFFINGAANVAFRDADGDGILNSLELDADNDGITDDNEEDFSGDGTALLPREGDPSYINDPDDNDGDGLYDFIDRDTEVTGLNNSPEDDGTVDGTDTDYDNDGIANSFELNGGGTGTAPVDTDSDGFYDFVDTDSDGDGFLDEEEFDVVPMDGICDDADEDGICDYIDSTDAIDLKDEAIGVTLNDDGVNDDLSLGVLAKAGDGTIKVFNRWGQTVYEANPYPNTGNDEPRWWQGTNDKGDPLPGGTYFYIIEYTSPNDGTKKVVSNYIYISR